MKIKALKSKWLCGKNFDEGTKYAKCLVYLKYLIRLSQDIHTVVRKALLNCPINVNSQIELVLSDTQEVSFRAISLQCCFPRVSPAG